MTTIKLNNGASIVAPKQVYSAIKEGHRLLDGAAVYGNGKEIGQGIARAFKDGLVTRQDLFVVSKLWVTHHEAVQEALDRTLSNLGLDYLDLCYHFPFSMGYLDPEEHYQCDWDVKFSSGSTPLHVTSAALEELQHGGKIKAIGVSNYNGTALTDLLNYGQIKPAALQLAKFAQNNGLHVVAYSTFGQTYFVELGRPRPKHMAHGKTPAQIILRWCTQRGICISVIPKSGSPKSLAENFSVKDFQLTEKEIKDIASLG
ncbi:NADPH-dependent D-xylose reductase II,III [Xylariaceae sp. FL1019]|nr:NADPH-dependent D-xylose reductase II,III [Xylariaceae sp. FL1019]